MAIAISPHYRDTDFPSTWSLDQKIQIFEDRIQGWQLDIAQLCGDSSPHAGFAVLSIVFSYFEMIAKFQDGYIKNDRSKTYFKKGLYNVFQNISNTTPGMREKLLNKLYEDVRCGLYHAGRTGPNIELSGNFSFPIAFISPPDKVQINPHRLVPALVQHFKSYILQLRVVTNIDLRQNFETRFDAPI